MYLIIGVSLSKWSGLYVIEFINDMIVFELVIIFYYCDENFFVKENYCICSICRGLNSNKVYEILVYELRFEYWLFEILWNIKLD